MPQSLTKAVLSLLVRYLSLFLLGSVFFSDTPLHAAASVSDDDPEVVTLINTKHFGFGEIDKEGHFTEGEAALKRIMKQDGSLQLLFAIFDRGTLAGKCYALVGIRMLAPSSFPEFVKKLDPWKGLRVRTATKERVIEEKLSDVIRMIDTGVYGEYLRVAE